MKKVTMMLLAVVLVLGLTACGSKTNTDKEQSQKENQGQTQGQTPGQTTTNVDVEAVYKQNCLACHASDLSGQVGPNLQKVGAKRTPEEISNIIHNGGNGMTAFKGVLSEDEIKALTDWLAAKK
ncbi:cytochrome c [Paenibacillus profundus]|uniref:Cytochrome c n=1 Tax=Paenibacillus profundus TaxID=1173085 RepID=A0ABS8YCR5_9BACL|nr:MULTISPECIES: cytochrome c [Paenibacillus]MCE5169019.1 cytochrome c [Paenibacillus profundus]